MRVLLAAVCLPALLAAQDARDIVRRAVELDRKNIQLTINYAYRERDEQHELDSQGKATKVKISVWDVTHPDGTPYRRLVARDDHPLSDEERKAEEEKLLKSVEDRRQETPEQRQRRISEWEARREKQRESLREISDAFDFRLAGEESLNGGQAYVIDATPKPGYKPKSSSAFFLPRVKARFWIDKTDYQWIKISVQSLSTISFAGFLVRIEPGSVATIEQVRVNGEVWLPKSIEVKLAAKVALVKTVRLEISTTYSDYKKFQADSRIVEITEPRKP
ncbi:MAG: hypothetical protein ABSF25_23550 [Bryobacteraceae bacterium]|jgi:hypothetical protein